MNESQFADFLVEAAIGQDFDCNQIINDARTFRDLGMMTNNTGYVVRCHDGSEYQVTVTQSKVAS